MTCGAIYKYKTRKMDIAVFPEANGGRMLAIDLTRANATLDQYRGFFSSRVEVEVGADGKAAKLRLLGGNGELCPTSALRKVVKHLAVQGVETLSYRFSDRIGSLEEHAELQPGKAIPLSVWRERLPQSASLLRTIDDGK